MKLGHIQRAAARRVRRGISVLTRRVRNVHTRLARDVPTFIAFVRILALGCVWAWFELHLRAWDWITPRLLRRLGIVAREPHRLLFCCLTAIAAGYVLLLAMRLPTSVWTLLGSAALGLGVHVWWRNGWLWCRHHLGIRPSRVIDLRDPYGNLVFRNS